MAEQGQRGVQERRADAVRGMWRSRGGFWLLGLALAGATPRAHAQSDGDDLDDRMADAAEDAAPATPGNVAANDEDADADDATVEGDDEDDDATAVEDDGGDASDAAPATDATLPATPRFTPESGLGAPWRLLFGGGVMPTCLVSDRGLGHEVRGIGAFYCSAAASVRSELAVPGEPALRLFVGATQALITGSELASDPKQPNVSVRERQVEATALLFGGEVELRLQTMPWVRLGLGVGPFLGRSHTHARMYDGDGSDAAVIGDARSDVSIGGTVVELQGTWPIAGWDGGALEARLVVRRYILSAACAESANVTALNTVPTPEFMLAVPL